LLSVGPHFKGRWAGKRPGVSKLPWGGSEIRPNAWGCRSRQRADSPASDVIHNASLLLAACEARILAAVSRRMSRNWPIQGASYASSASNAVSFVKRIGAGQAGLIGLGYA